MARIVRAQVSVGVVTAISPGVYRFYFLCRIDDNFSFHLVMWGFYKVNPIFH